MKYYFDHWYSSPYSKYERVSEQGHYLDLSGGSYVHILHSMDIENGSDTIEWEIILEDNGSIWIDKAGEAVSLEEAKDKIISLLDKSGYKKLDIKYRTLE